VRHEVYPTASYGVLLKKRSGRGIIAEHVYPEERSEDFHPEECNEDVEAD
jgi:hypothetical protein